MSKECLLKKVEEQELNAKKFGFYWTEISQLIEQIQSECREVEEAWHKKDRNHLQEEVGDVIQAAVSLAVFCGLDPHDTLQKSIEKFQKRYDAVVDLAQKEGLNHLHQQPFDILLSYWNRAKAHSG